MATTNYTPGAHSLNVSTTSSGASGGTTLGGVSTGLAIGGALSSAIGAYYSVKAAQYQARSRASALEHQQQLSYINAREAERDAQDSLMSGQREAARAGLRYAQVKATMDVRRAAGGIQAGVGSAGEVAASVEYAKQSDQLAITRNSVREANAHRTGRVNSLNRASAAGVEAVNLRSTARGMNAGLSATTSLIGSAGAVASNWYSLNKTK